MREFYGDQIVHITQFIGNAISDLMRFPADDTAVLGQSELDDFERIVVDLKQVSLKLCALTLREIKDDTRAGNLTYNQIAEQLRGLQDILRREMSLCLFMQVPQHKAEYYSKSDLFGMPVVAAFPSAAFDVTEAGNCFAAGRDTACVFHLMRALELPLRLLAKEVGLPEKGSPSWNHIIGQIEKTFTDVREGKIPKPPDWKDKEQFYSEAAALLRNVKNAWRNNVMHLEKKYTEEDAKRLLDTSRAMMQFLATRLHE